MGSAVLTPSLLAGMEAAVTMLRLSDGSPDTTDGTSLMSGCPSAISFTAAQLRKAELASMWNMTLLNFIRTKLARFMSETKSCEAFGG